MDNNLYGRRTNAGKISLSTNTTNNSSNGNDTSSSRSATLPRRFGGDSSSHGKSNAFNVATTPGGSRIMSPTTGGASSAFGLGSGAFSSFGSAKTPKSAGNPFDFPSKSAAAPASASTSTTSLAGEKSSSATPRPAGAANPASGAIGSKSAGSAAAGATAQGGKERQYPLRNEWVFWFRPPISKANGYIEYEKTLHPIATASTVEEFFSIYTHLKRPSTLPLVSDYHLFRKGIRPIWEDAENRKGGKWIVRLKKGVADRYWEDLLLAVIGDQFGDATDEVCGIVLSVRNGEDILSIWARTDGGRVLRIRETMKRVLSFPLDTKLEWKSHDSSIQQRSAIEESRREKQQQQQPNNHHHHNNNHHHHNNNRDHGYHQSDKRTSKQNLSLQGADEQQQYGHGTP